MEVSEPFPEYNYLIEVVRKFIFPNFLMKKRDLLKCYCRLLHCNNHDHSNSIERYFEIDKCYDDSYRLRHFNITSCTVNERKLTKQDILSYFRDAKGSTMLCFKKLVEELITPNKLDKKVIEKEAGKKIYPLNKTQLLEFISFKFFKRFYFNLFMNANFVKINNQKIVKMDDCIMVKNGYNDIQLSIPRDIIKMYCGFNFFIEDVEEKVDYITVPFVFNQRASSFLLNCLINGYFINHKINKFTEADFEELRQFFAYLQITFK